MKAWLQAGDSWSVWQSCWADQQYRTRVYQLADIPGNTRVMTREYKRSRTRNGTRVQVQLPNSSGVLQPYACEVLLFLELQLKQHAASVGGSPNSSATVTAAIAAAGGQHDNMQAVLLAVLRRFNTVVRTDQPELADMMLEAMVDDFDPQPYVVAVSDIVCALMPVRSTVRGCTGCNCRMWHAICSDVVQ